MGPAPELLIFAAALACSQAVCGTDELLCLFEKPWKWADAFETWEQNGKPMDFTDPGWEEFAAEAMTVRA